MALNALVDSFSTIRKSVGLKWLKQASYGLCGSTGLKMPIHVHFFRRVILTCKVGQTDLDFGVRSGFICMSVHARLQVFVCSG